MKADPRNYKRMNFLEPKVETLVSPALVKTFMIINGLLTFLSWFSTTLLNIFALLQKYDQSEQDNEFEVYVIPALVALLVLLVARVLGIFKFDEKPSTVTVLISIIINYIVTVVCIGFFAATNCEFVIGNTLFTVLLMGTIALLVAGVMSTYTVSNTYRYLLSKDDTGKQGVLVMWQNLHAEMKPYHNLPPYNYFARQNEHDSFELHGAPPAYYGPGQSQCDVMPNDIPPVYTPGTGGFASEAQAQLV